MYWVAPNKISGKVHAFKICKKCSTVYELTTDIENNDLCESCRANDSGDESCVVMSR